MCLEYGCSSMNKYGEELCGDNVEAVTLGEWTTLVLADGLGSGVKANILSTLTAKILCTMVSNDIDLYECVETIIQTLPVCSVRGVAYSTFSIIHINTEGEGYLFEFDNPQAILIHQGHCGDLQREALNVCDKTVYKSELRLSKDDMVVVMSDGTIHAGIGMILNFGWDRKEIMAFLDSNLKPNMSARAVATLFASACNDLYLDKPGDDTTVAVVRYREPVKVNLMVGPPVDKEKDNEVVARFLSGTSVKVVCGGTSSTIVARYLNKPLRTSFDFPDKEVPPIGFIDGIDLTTEGVITLKRVFELSERYMDIHDLTAKTFTKQDGASLLANLLFERASSIEFFVGRTVNTAHQGLPIDLAMKMKLVEHLAKNLKLMGKQVRLNYD